MANLDVFSLTRRRTAAPTLSARGKMIPDDGDHDVVDDDNENDDDNNDDDDNADNDDDYDDDDDEDEDLPAPDEVG